MKTIVIDYRFEKYNITLQKKGLVEFINATEYFDDLIYETLRYMRDILPPEKVLNQYALKITGRARNTLGAVNSKVLERIVENNNILALRQ